MKNSFESFNRSPGIDQTGSTKEDKNKGEGSDLTQALSEFTQVDAEIAREELKVLAHSVIPNLQDKITNFKVLEQQSAEITKLYQENKIPAQMRHMYGNQAELDSMRDKLNGKKKELEDLKKNILSKNIEAIKLQRDKRLEGYTKEQGIYSISGEESQENEDTFNQKIQQEKTEEIIDRLSKLN